MNQDERQVASAKLLLSRLERLSADSYWAHQASGLRGSLLRCLQQIEPPSGANAFDPGEQHKISQHLGELVKRGFEVLGLAAQAISRPTTSSRKR